MYGTLSLQGTMNPQACPLTFNLPEALSRPRAFNSPATPPPLDQVGQEVCRSGATGDPARLTLWLAAFNKELSPE